MENRLRQPVDDDVVVPAMNTETYIAVIEVSPSFDNNSSCGGTSSDIKTTSCQQTIQLGFP